MRISNLEDRPSQFFDSNGNLLYDPSDTVEVCVPALITYEPGSFLVDKLRDHDVVLLGTKHNLPATLEDVTEILPTLACAGVTHIGLEIATDQQLKIDQFNREGTGLEEIDIFHVIDCPEYRHLLGAIRTCNLKPLALDLPRSMWKARTTRDQWMAKGISAVFDETPDAKVLVIVGNLHALKRIDWIDSAKKDTFINGYLSRYRPELDVFSVLVECTDPSGGRCDFHRLFAREKKPVAVETFGLDLELGVLRLLAIKQMEACEAADAVIVY